MKLPWSRSVKRVSKDPDYVCILVKGIGDANPDSCRVKHNDWVCWVNPKSSGGKGFAVNFVAKNPLKDVHGKPLPKGAVIRVGKGAPSCWYQFKGGVRKGDRFEYKLSRKASDPGPVPGPEIIAGD